MRVATSAVWGLLAALAVGTAQAAVPAKLPYYSVQLATAPDRAGALEQLKPWAAEPYIRAEQRSSGWQIRAGAWKVRADAEAALKRMTAAGARNARVLSMQTTVPWLLPDGSVAAAGTPFTPAVAAPGPAAAAPVAVAPAAPAPAPAAAPRAAEPQDQDLTELSLEELLDVQVTSMSKHAEPLRRAAGAVAVISGDEIRRSGARTIAQAMRLVPGLQVYRTNAQNYTITARGFTSDKLEVLLDGRSVYTPLSSSVFWDVLDTFRADIDRIEVIRGPGATLWGANAVNGVINIVTKRAADTQGTQTSFGAGVEEKAFAAFRSGERLGDSGYGRIYAKAFERDSSVQRDGSDTFDGQRHAETGFRTDWGLGAAQDLTVSGDFYYGRQTAKQLSANARGDDTEVTGANLLGRWTYRTSSDSEISAQAYYDGYHRLIPEVFDEKRDTGDLEIQHRFALAPGTSVTYGAGYRASHDETGGPPLAIIFNPRSRTLSTYSAFAQLQHDFDRGVELTVGSKYEHNTYTGDEVQPGVRVGWTLGENAFTWAALSRAVRLPNRLDEDIAIFCSPGLDVLLGCTLGTTVRIGNPDFKSEKVTALEWGLRWWTGSTTLELATFYNDYTDLRSTESTPPPIGSFANNIEAQSYGGEVSLTWAPLAWLSVRPFYSYLEIDAREVNGGDDTITPANLEGGSPRNSAGLQIGVAPVSSITMDAFLRYVDEIERQQVPDYTELNLRLGWKPLPALELALVGTDLLDDSHAEAGTAPSRTTPNPPPPATEIERAGWVQVTWSWQ